MSLSKTRVSTATCPFCKDELYSRAGHDFRYCSCKKTFVDGGFGYMRIGGESKPKIRIRYVNASRRELFDDWNTHRDKFGFIK